MSRDEDYIPELIVDNNTKTTYKKGRFFGKGGFAKCYEIVDAVKHGSFAGKIISKKLMAKQNQREKMTQEIQIHQSLKHINIVGFYSFFEDNLNIYIVLELCRKRSMMELHKRRKVLSEPEVRFYMRQIINGVCFLHDCNIIHRDLKLGNLFLNDELTVKIGDFGLAARIEFEGERKKTLCGTPNYIAPEILHKKGHSFEVDIWSIGCIMYTLLVGRPPFETSSLRETYARIKKCDYKISEIVSAEAKHMIVSMLQLDPESRPGIHFLQNSVFMVNGYTPPSLPVSSLTMAPRFDRIDTNLPSRKPLSGLNTMDTGGVISPNAGHNKGPFADTGHGFKKPNMMAQHLTAFDAKDTFLTLRSLLHKVLKTKPIRNQKVLDEMTDPAAQPTIWISKWVDYSDKYGFGYQLSDEGMGVMFNDTTKLIMLSNGINVHYIDKNGEESYMTLDNYPRPFDKKMKLLSYFSRYMREHLIKTGADAAKETDSISRTPHLHQWCRSTNGVLMQLNNGTVQINFSDHTKIIMCPLMAAITYIDEDKLFRTFRFSTIETNGCTSALYEKMRYAYDKFTVLLSQNQ